MGDFGLYAHDWITGYPAASGTTYYIGVQSSVSAHTKGSWSELIAAAPFDGFLHLDFPYHASGRFMADVGIGGAGSEFVILANWPIIRNPGGQTTGFILPILVPSGARVALRTQQGAAGAYWLYCTGHLFPAKAYHGQLCVGSFTVGADTADTTLVSVDPGGTIDTKGAWVEIVSSLADSVKGWFVAGFGLNGMSSYPHYAIDVAIGGAGSEQIVYANKRTQPFATNKPDTFILHSMLPLPAGTRVAARCACSHNTSPGRILDMAFYGMVG